MTTAKKHNTALGLAFILCLIALAGILLAVADGHLAQRKEAAPPDPPVPSAMVIMRSLTPWLPGYPQAAEQQAYEWARRHAQGRLQTVQVVPRSPQAFGPWSAEWNPDLVDAPSDGSLAEWDVCYYVTHSWSGYGLEILDMQPGDTVTINDQTILIEGIFDYPKQSILDEIIVLVGDATVFQTCVPGADYNRIVYGWQSPRS
ncbi:MAG: hypothetical protein IJ092_13780 [Atopobiaceae bacterium]|nr:hypothetical protein [Atopobiaceae bacterium]